MSLDAKTCHRQVGNRHGDMYVHSQPIMLFQSVNLGMDIKDMPSAGMDIDMVTSRLKDIFPRHIRKATPLVNLKPHFTRDGFPDSTSNARSNEPNFLLRSDPVFFLFMVFF